MLEVSQGLKEYLNQKGRHFKAKIECYSDTVYEGIMSISVTRPLCSDTLTFGNVNIAFCNIALYDTPVVFSSKEFTVYIMATNGTEEWIKLGDFIAEKSTVSGKVTTFTAYDCIKYKTDITYFPSFKESAVPVADVFEDICSKCAVPFVPLEVKTLINPSLLSGYKCKDALGQIAGFIGGNIVTDNEGRLVVRKFCGCDYKADENMIGVPEISEEITSFNGISCITQQGTLVSGIDYGNHITFSNVLMTQEQLNLIWDEVKDIYYNALTVNILVGTPLLEVGDVFMLNVFDRVYKVPLMHYEIDFDGGIMNTCKSLYKTPSENKSKVSASEKIQEMSEEIKNVKDSVDGVKADNGSNSDFIKLLNSALGLYFSKETLSDGSEKIYGHDNPVLAQSTYIFTMNAEGFAFVTGENCWNKGNPQWQNGITKDGNAIINYLIAKKISADIIEAGVIKSVDGTTVFDLNRGEITQRGSGNNYAEVAIRNYLLRVLSYKVNENYLEGILLHPTMGFMLYDSSIEGSLSDMKTYAQITKSHSFFSKLLLNEPLAIEYGGTGAVDAATARIKLGITLANLGAASNTHNHDGRYLKVYGLNEINIDEQDGTWVVDISEHGHGTLPEIVEGTAETWINVFQRTSGHFRIQEAVKCDMDDNPERKTRAVWYRNKYASSAWSAWTGVSLL